MAEQAKKDEKPTVAPDKDKVADDDLEKVSGGVGGPEEGRDQPLRISRVPQS